MRIFFLSNKTVIYHHVLVIQYITDLHQKKYLFGSWHSTFVRSRPER